MTFDMYRSGGDPLEDAVDHWLDEALRAVPLPDGFFARMCTLADAPPDRADGRDGAAQRQPHRGADATLRPAQASTYVGRPQ
jgi:hypothetical protein